MRPLPVTDAGLPPTSSIPAYLLWLARHQLRPLAAGALTGGTWMLCQAVWPALLGRAVVAARGILRVGSAVGDPARPLPAPGPDAMLADPTSGLVLRPGQLVALVAEDPDDGAALARRLGRFDDADVLVLVEPTSAVDAHTEDRIARRLRAARAGRTTLVLTSSPLLLGQADEVLTLAGGRVTARETCGAAAHR